jgi:SWI/SNF-related matrix-associated actin-dependent regulator 1 of chromatin subfamily A
MMAPAGTVFRAPPAALPRRTQPAVKNQFPSKHISDDDLANDYKRVDSSEDDLPMRGEIRPSSFVKKQISPVPVSRAGPKIEVKEDKEREFNSISDMRLRYLTKQTHKIVSKVKPEITVAACRDALQRNNKSVEDAASSLIADVHKIPTASNNGSTFDSASKASTMSRTIQEPQQTTWKQTKLPGQQKSRNNSSSPPPSPEPAKNPAPRRRLMQGRRKRSPTPPPVFSVSSSHATSAATTPSSSSSERLAKMAVATKESQSQEVVNRRRLIPGTHKQPAPSHNVITIGSSSGSDSDLPDISAIASRKRKASQAAPEPDRKTRPRLVSAASLKVKAKPVPAVIDLSDDGEAFVSADDSESGSDARMVTSGVEHASVLGYINGCTAEELARMTSSSLKDAQFVVSKRPFASISQIRNVKAKSAKKSKKDDVGPAMVEKLDTWYKAFDAVTEVIGKCAERGRELQAIMSKWEMDKNGKIKDENENDTTEPFSPLPIPVRPARMAESIQLKSYQLFGLNWMKLLHDHSYGGILADDMGLGKTCQVISFISHLVEFDNSAKPNLIVVPPSTLENWVSEFETFAPDISVFLYSGTYGIRECV